MSLSFLYIFWRVWQMSNRRRAALQLKCFINLLFSGLLQRDEVSPDYPRLHRSGRRSDWNGTRRSFDFRSHISRRDTSRPEARRFVAHLSNSNSNWTIANEYTIVQYLRKGNRSSVQEPECSRWRTAVPTRTVPSSS